ncbi:MAG: hypothetical protein P4L41_13425 [Flavipsychrobacter sp.]|nr:hypothetical protein [Flavipsychrobacter sp.]
MYCITEQQIEYILNDIRRNGVEMEDLQLNLLDHVCCIVEQELEEDDDFERFYHEVIKQFYKKELHEIEEETINLLTFKNYYTMKKLMIISGIVSATAFVIGSFFKIMAWQGTILFLMVAMGIFSFIFLPLLVVLKVKETDSARNKIVLVIAATVGVLYSMGTLFVAMQWHGGTALLFATVGTSAFLLIPTYFFTGIRNAETKVNTIVTTVLMVGATGLMFTLVRVHQPLPMQTYTYLKNEQLLRKMQRDTGAQSATANKVAVEINTCCEQIKHIILSKDLAEVVPVDFEQKDIIIHERSVNFPETSEAYRLLAQLKNAIDTYNVQIGTDDKISVSHTILDIPHEDLRKCTNFFVLNSLTQIQLSLVSNEPHPVVMK